MLPGFIFGGAAMAFTALLVATYYHARAISKSDTDEERLRHTGAHLRAGRSLLVFGLTVSATVTFFLEKFFAKQIRNVASLPWLNRLHLVSVATFLVLAAILSFWLTGKTWKKHPLGGRICLTIGLLLEIEGWALYFHYFK